MMRSMRVLAVALVAATLSCSREPEPVAQSGATSSASIQTPTEADIPNDSLGASIRRGLALILHTPDSLPDYAPGNITCGNCHLQGGRSSDAVPLIGSHVRFPKYLDRSGAVVALADRVNYCVTRSLAGNKLPVDSREMQDMLAYIAWLSRGVAVGDGEKAPGAMGLPTMPITLRGDRSQGEKVYQVKCAVCHLPTGEGVPTAKPAIPALWGPKSFSIGASMARESKAASFIWYNMPLGLGKSLTPKEAYDVAAYITSKPRPDSPGKENDWPGGGAPADVPYATRGHSAYNPPPLLPRATPTRTIVSAPKRAQSR